jgi:hypothetical protein
VAESDDGKASLHLHAVLGCLGSHLLSGSVRLMREVTINETVKNMQRKKRPSLGIAREDSQSIVFSSEFDRFHRTFSVAPDAKLVRYGDVEPYFLSFQLRKCGS